MATISGVQKHFATPSEVYTNNLSASISAGAVTVPVNANNDYADGDIVVLTVEPGTTNEATFTGEKASSPARFINCVWTEGNLGVGHASGVTITDYDSATHLAMMTKGIKVSHNQDGTLKPASVNLALGVSDTAALVNPAGSILDYAGRIAPTGWLLCNGAAVSRATYASLLNAILPVIGQITISVATPGVGTLIGHGLATGDAIQVTTTGALPTGLSPTTQLFAIYVDANTFRFATSYANAIAGTAIATTGTQSGTHTLRFAPHGVGDGSTTFNLPDLRGRVVAGADNMGGTSADRLTGNSVNGDVLGATGGTEKHVHSAYTEIAGSIAVPAATIAWQGVYYAGGSAATKNAGIVTINKTGDADSSVQPTIIMNKIIKT